MTTRRKPPAPMPPAPPAPPPPPAEATRIIEAVARREARGPRFAVKLGRDADGKINSLEPHHADRAGFRARTEDAFGTSSHAFAISQVNGLLNALRPVHGLADETTLNGVLAVIDGLRPRDEAEAMLAAQMAVSHRLAMDCLGRAARGEHLAQVEAHGNLAVKLMRTYAVQLEALERLRRGGEQRVIVEHVHIHAGGQAIVGNVAPGAVPRGEGGERK